MHANVFTLKGSCAGVQVDNILGVGSLSIADSAALDDMADAIHTNWASYVLTTVSSKVSLDHISGISLDDPTAGTEKDYASSGGVPGDILPTFVVAKVNWVTGLRGRAYKGRTGLTGIPESWTSPTDPNVLGVSYQSQMQIHMRDFVDNCNTDLAALTNASTLAVISQVLHGVPRVPALAQPIVRASVPNELGTRRSRM